MGLFSRGDLLVKRGDWRSADGDQFLATQLHKEPFHASDGPAVQGKAAGMSRGGRQTGLPTETER